MRPSRLITLAAGASALVLVASACGGGDGDGGGGQTITSDGSSTVGPFTTKAAEDFKAEGGVDVTVGISGTGGGFERFCRDETDVSNASRPIKDEEAAICADAGSSTSSSRSRPTRSRTWSAPRTTGSTASPSTS